MNNKEKIGINASFLRKLNTGLGQVSFGFLREISRNRNASDFRLYLEEESDVDFLEKFEKSVFLPGYKRDDLIRKIWWEMCMLPGKAKRDGVRKFISIYQCPTVMPKGVEHIMIVHDIIPKIFPEYLNNSRKKLYWFLTEKAIKRADKIIAISENTKKDLVNILGISEDKISVAAIDVDDVYKSSLSDEQIEKTLSKYGLKRGYVYSGGGLEKRKNFERLILAYKQLAERNKNVAPLVISGKLMPELAPLVTDIEKIVKESGLEDRVKLLGFVPQEDLPAIYAGARLFVYPSVYEGFGLPVLEAMNVGVPVLASNRTSIPEVGGSELTYFDPENISDISEKMEELLKDENLRQNISVKYKERSKKFSWKNFTEKVLNV